MGRKAILAVACWLVAQLCAGIKVDPNPVKDRNVGDSGHRLYRNAPFGVYASAAPYGSFSFHVPITIPDTKSNTRYTPVKQENVVIQNSNGFLKDSYGNKFVESPQSATYKTILPQQYVQLQNLPAHLSQPLTVAAPGFHFQQGSPQPLFGSQFKFPTLQNLQSVTTAPLTRYGTIAHPFVYAGDVKNLSPASTPQFTFQGPAKSQLQSSNNNVIYSTQAVLDYNPVLNEQKFQRLEESSKENDSYEAPRPQPQKEVPKPTQTKHVTAVKTFTNGKESVVHLETKPPLPLLDLSLLEPLTFANPVVPQVQHYLPKINAVTYHKLPLSNEGDLRKHKKPPKKVIDGNYEHRAPAKPINKVKVKQNESPEITYEINSPNYKETFKQQVVSYNKETQKDPVNYSYKKHTQKEPVHYTFSHNSKDPGQTKVVQYVKKDPVPSHLVYSFNPVEQSTNSYKEVSDNPNLQESSDDSSEASEDTEDEGLTYDHSQFAGQQNHDTPSYLLKPEHREQVRQSPNQGIKGFYDAGSQKPPQFYSHSALTAGPQFPQFMNQYGGNLRFVPFYQRGAAIKLNPNQPIKLQHPKNQNQRLVQQFIAQQSYPTTPRSRSEGHMEVEPTIYEKSKKIIIQEESPEELHSHREQMSSQTVGQGDDSEEDFEKSYKEAAYGFPAYDKESNEENEEQFYNPDNYGEPRESDKEEVKESTQEHYQEEREQVPKSLGYNDAKDKLKESYFLDYSINRPESLTDRYQSKINYYKQFVKQRPKEFDDKKKQKSKYTAQAAAYFDSTPKHKPKQQAAQYKSAPVYEYDYSKEARDNAARASRPSQYKSKTHFVEPQFQYGFEPIALPRLLDSELATMASNDSPESEKPGTRKKLYKENWYIKKTTTSGGKRDS